MTAGIDGALILAADLCGNEIAQRIQLDIAYAPEPPFGSGTPESAPAEILAAARSAGADLRRRREMTAARFASESPRAPVAIA